MKVLIVDDSDYKIENLSSLIKGLDFATSLEIARSFQGGIKTIKQFHPDLILLDMTLPTSESMSGQIEGRTRIYGGREILLEMEFHEISSKVIVVTQFDRFGEGEHSETLETLFKQLKNRFSESYIGGVYYSNFNSLWKNQLTELIKELKGYK